MPKLKRRRVLAEEPKARIKIAIALRQGLITRIIAAKIRVPKGWVQQVRSEMVAAGELDGGICTSCRERPAKPRSLRCEGCDEAYLGEMAARRPKPAQRERSRPEPMFKPKEFTGRGPTDRKFLAFIPMFKVTTAQKRGGGRKVI